MKTIAVRELGAHWAELEKTLAEQGEIIVTSDSRPIAKLVPLPTPASNSMAPAKKGKQKGFDAAAHMQWLKRISKDDPPNMRSSDEILHEIRNDGHYLPPGEPLP